MLVRLLREDGRGAKAEIWRVVRGTMSHRSMMVVLLPTTGRKSVRMRQHLLVLEIATWWPGIWLIQPTLFDAIRDDSFQKECCTAGLATATGLRKSERTYETC